MKDIETIEREKYTKTWGQSWYRQNSPALRDLKHVRRWIDKHAIEHVLDFGCGSGKIDLCLRKDGRSVRMIDIAENCLDKETADALDSDLTFEVGCLWSDEMDSIRGDGVVCVDVLEHLPEDKVITVCEHIRNAAPHGYVNAALFPHRFKGEDLHLTLKPASWWFELFPDATHSVRRNKHAFMVW